MRKTNESGKEGTAFELSLGNYVIDNEVLHNIPTSSLNSIVEREASKGDFLSIFKQFNF